MKKILVTAATAAACILGAGHAAAEEVRDWRDLEAVHKHLEESLNEMLRAQKANHYDMGGHAAKAEQDIREALQQLHEAIEARKHDKH